MRHVIRGASFAAGLPAVFRLRPGCTPQAISRQISITSKADFPVLAREANADAAVTAAHERQRDERTAHARLFAAVEILEFAAEPARHVGTGDADARRYRVGCYLKRRA
ncbi:hypothetical protein [Burkholderia pyrrocinia]